MVIKTFMKMYQNTFRYEIRLRRGNINQLKTSKMVVTIQQTLG